MDSTKYIKNIIEANNDKRLAIFVGAGISKSSETKSFKLPLWNDLISDLKKDLNTSENDFLKIAQLYYLAFGEYTYYKKLKDYFPTNIKPSIVHKLIFELNPNIVITTNWDYILEKTIEENGFIYEVICSDRDLVKSTLQQKVIKMHGDFKNHNIVFKEDDYLNYKHNFPLIENYIKSILSTHTVIFLGYSYSDIDLKQITKWLQNHSNVKPPAYITVFKENLTESKYLENHGISTILLDEYESKQFDLSEPSKKIYEFLLRIKDFEKYSLPESEDAIINYIYKKIIVLDNLDGILLEQIQQVLGNCGFLYEKNEPILEFYSSELTTDYNLSIRNVYRRFEQILDKIDETNPPNKKLEKIFEILYKANVMGIVKRRNPDEFGTKYYLEIRPYVIKNVNDYSSFCFDFNFKEIEPTTGIRNLLDLAYKKFQLGFLEETNEILESIIRDCIKERNYTWLFLSMLNRNIVLNRLKTDLKYIDVQNYDLKEKLNELPKDLQITLGVIHSFIDISFIYKYAFIISEKLENKENSKRIIESGGLVFNSNINELLIKHKNLVLFVLRNQMFIESYPQYRTINKNFIKISLVRQFQNEKVTLSKIELYTCIKYLDDEELKSLFERFYSEDLGSLIKLEINNEDKLWILNTVFVNIVENYINIGVRHSNFLNNLKSIIFILSLIELKQEEVNSIINLFSKILKEGKNTIGIYESIDLFLAIKYSIFKTKIKADSLLTIFEVIVRKIINRTYNGQEYFALTKNKIRNFYGYLKESTVIIKNKKLINALIASLNEYQLSEQIEISQSLLLNIYYLSDAEIKDEIKDFLLSIDSSKESEFYKKIIFDLMIVLNGFKEYNTNIELDITIFLNELEDKKQFNSILYTIQSYVNNLVKLKGMESLNNILERIKSIITKYESRENPSIF